MERIITTQQEQQIGEILSGPVLRDESMSRHTSMGVGGPAELFAVPSSRGELAALVSYLSEQGIPFCPVGNGTNLLVRDGGVRGVVISLGNLQAVEVRKTEDGVARIDAEAGVPLARLVEIALRESLAGVEFLAGIPGTLGGALRMNAGAWGASMEEVTDSLVLVSPVGEFVQRRKEHLAFSYRTLRLPEQHSIVAAVLNLQPADAGLIEHRMAEVLELRRRKHPLGYRSAGSIFKNPSAAPAGKLIEEAGLKGLKVGDVRVSEKHGNFIIAEGQATASDVIALIDAVRERVKQRAGVELEMEVIIIGENRNS